jgi:carboxymethylenebutenolidase
MRILFIGLLLAGMTVTAFAARERRLTYTSGDEKVHARLFVPAGKGPFPALVVVHQWWGLNDWIRQQASRLADQGYVTLAVDLYGGKVTSDLEEAKKLISTLSDDRSVRNLRAAFAALAARRDVDSSRMGAIGWSMGGRLALLLAAAEPKLKAVVDNYGHPLDEPAAISEIKAATLVLYGGQDRYTSEAEVRRFEERMNASGNKVEVVIYPEAGHDFDYPRNKLRFRPADAADSWNRTLAFLQAELKR